VAESGIERLVAGTRARQYSAVMSRVIEMAGVLIALAWPAIAAAEGDAAPQAEASPQRWHAAMSVEFGTLRRPSYCQGYCEHAYGPALGGSAGYRVSSRHVVVAEAWLFQREARGLLGGIQLLLGERAWLRGSAGVMATSHHNADGGGGSGVGPAASLGAGVRVARYDRVATEVSARATLVKHEAGIVTSWTVGYGIAW
jgi:hypothetical protein